MNKLLGAIALTAVAGCSGYFAQQNATAATAYDMVVQQNIRAASNEILKWWLENDTEALKTTVGKLLTAKAVLEQNLGNRAGLVALAPSELEHAVEQLEKRAKSDSSDNGSVFTNAQLADIVRGLESKQRSHRNAAVYAASIAALAFAALLHSYIFQAYSRIRRNS